MNQYAKGFARSVIGAAALFALTGIAQAQEVLKIGRLASLAGPFAAPGQDRMRRADPALTTSPARNGLPRPVDVARKPRACVPLRLLERPRTNGRRDAV